MGRVFDAKNNNNNQNSERNFDLRQKHSSEEKKSKAIFHFNFYTHKKIINYSIILLATFSILSMAIGPQSEANYAFAKADYNSDDDEIQFNVEDGTSLSSSSSTLETISDSIDPFVSAENNTEKENDKYIAPNIDGLNNVPSNDSSSASSSSKSQSQQSAQTYYESYHQYDLNNPEIGHNSIETDDKSRIGASPTDLQRDPVNDDKPGIGISSTDPQIDTSNNYNSNNIINEKTDGNVSITNNQSNTSEPSSTQSSKSSHSGVHPKFMSYREFIENSNSSIADNMNVSGGTQTTELDSTYSQPDVNYNNYNGVNKNNSPDNDNNSDLNSANNEDLSSTSSLTSTATSQLSAQASNEVYGDFDGDGFDDLASGIPNEDVGICCGEGYVGETGAVSIIYGYKNGLDPKLGDQLLTQASLSGIPSSDGRLDSFGSSLALGDFNGDGFDDLAIGVPNDLIDGTRVGSVYVVYGTVLGLGGDEEPNTPLQVFLQGVDGINDSGEEGDQFGSSLTSGDFNADGKDDLAIGVPDESVGSISNAGGVEVIYGSSSGLSSTLVKADQFWTQDSSNVDNSAETDDHFGSSLTSGDFNADGKDDLAIGVSNENVVSISNAGGVQVIYGTSSGLSATSPIANQFWTQDSSNVDNSAETDDLFGYSLTSGDFNADGKDDLAIGVPEEHVGPISNAGGAQVIYGSSSGLSATLVKSDQFWTQDSTNVDDTAENDDSFGFSLTSGDFNADGKDDLAIGVPDEEVGSIPNAGGVEVIYGSSSGLSATLVKADQFWTQDSPDIENDAELSDLFGYSLTSGDFNADGKDDLAISAIFEDVGPGPSAFNGGGVEVIYGSSSGLSATLVKSDQFWTQDSTSVKDFAEDGDEFGFAIG
jgi:hypothetical protein